MATVLVCLPYLLLKVAWVSGWSVGASIEGFRQLATGRNPFSGDEVLSPWVFGMVYGGFILQGSLLLPGFLLYARDRWNVVTAGGGVRQAVAGRDLCRTSWPVPALAALAAAAATAGLPSGRAAHEVTPGTPLARVRDHLPQRTQ